jgi:hypothetical protein
LNRNVHQGLHGEGFIHALACAAGFTTARMNLDLDGVDWQIAHPGPRGTTRSPKIEMQVKSTSAPLVKDGVIHQRLDDPASVTVRVLLRNLLTVDALGCLLAGDLGGAAR